MEIEGCVALVTGGASGIGRGVVEQFHRLGARVVVIDLPESAGAELARDLCGRALFVATDVTDTEAVATAVRSAVETFGRVDVLVNAAGISPAARVVARDGTLFPLDTFRLALDVNLVGAFDVLRQAAGAMAGNPPGVDGERGVVVNISSIAAMEGQVGQAAYTASKGGLMAMTLPLARDLAAHGIRVLTICPGTIDTPMVAATGPQVRESLGKANVFPHRLGRPDDIAAVIRTCVETTYLNGETIRVDAAVRLAPR